MARGSALKAVNVVLGILMLNQVVTALLSDTLPGESFEFLHVGGGILLVVATVLHVTLNWNWVRANFLRRPASPKT